MEQVSVTYQAPPEHIFEAMLDSVSYETKPEGMAGAVRNRLAAEELTESALCAAIANGRSFQFGMLDGKGFKQSNWVSQQLAAADFDNKTDVLGPDGKPLRDENNKVIKRDLEPGEPGYIDPVDAVQRAYDAGLPPMALYFTFSSTLEHPKFRLVFLLAEPVTDPSAMKAANLGLLALFPEADTSCKDLVRLYFGSGGEVWPCWMANDGELCDAAKMASFAKPAEKPAPMRISGRRRKMKRDEVHISDVLHTFDLLGLIRADTGENGYSSADRIDFPACPICGHRDCFSYYPQSNSYYCFSDSHVGNCGDALAYIMERDSLAYPEAKEVLGGLID